MPDGYDSHADYMQWVSDKATARETNTRHVLLDAFKEHVETREVEFINFAEMSAYELASAIFDHQVILKPLLAACNVAGRAIERDLGIRNVNTYRPRLTTDQASVIAGYLKPFLPRAIAVPALVELDRHFFVDKQIRLQKGRWERTIVAALNRLSSREFKKRKFDVHGEKFELDAATPVSGPIEIGVDVKRIEARRDIHKRCDEIVNKAAKLKQFASNSVFVAVIYYPFTEDHSSVRQRLDSAEIDQVHFASRSGEQLDTVIGLLVDKLGIR